MVSFSVKSVSQLVTDVHLVSLAKQVFKRNAPNTKCASLLSLMITLTPKLVLEVFT